METPIAIGISSCLLGERVRYDGGHKHDRYLTDTLGAFFRLVPVCPEVGCGLPAPREPMRLEEVTGEVRLVTTRSRIDHTERMRRWYAEKVGELAAADLCGFIFKKDSPSSGLFRVKVHRAGMPARMGRGLFAEAVTARFPLLPVEEEGRLHDLELRENFVVRIFAYRRWKDLVAGGGTPGRLAKFHTAHKLLLMAHSPELCRELGGLVARGKEVPRDELFARYGALFMKALARLATVPKNTAVLRHIACSFRKRLPRDERDELGEVIDEYRRRLVPLVVPVTLLRHYARTCGDEYLLGQVYLTPTPTELMLRNHV
ncbi:YbgA family protein [Geobacter pickeringii]|uniref:DUF1722 domain-containing protein n=1 Tax=Geobacter pickeringii TaxID=345632 RepID=A0A0B5BK24_9BACT|nr:DUF523 and DUF1722 domain-containing protein [Geobacter pickeringii]AJE04416.1 hypothetical protein GPICK_14580 [Geobacter pickeringii]